MSPLAIILVIAGVAVAVWILFSALSQRRAASSPYQKSMTRAPAPASASVEVSPAQRLPATPDATQAMTFIRTYQFDGSVTRSLRDTYPLSSEQCDLVLQGLRQWFEVCLRCELQPTWMPSRVVDAAWHAFICSTRNYREFCLHAFGRFLDHQPAEVMADALHLPDSQRRTWIAACACAGLDHGDPNSLPLLFSLDARLNIPDGMHFQGASAGPAQPNAQSLSPLTGCSSSPGWIMPLLIGEMASSLFFDAERPRMPEAPPSDSLRDSRAFPADASFSDANLPDATSADPGGCGSGDSGTSSDGGGCGGGGCGGGSES